MSSTSRMHDGGESDGRIVPTKGSNKGGQPSAENLEGRGPAKENIEQPTPPRTQSRISEPRGLLGVREAARKDTKARFTALLHHVTTARLRDSFYALKRDAVLAALLLLKYCPVVSVVAPCERGARLGATPALHHGLLGR